MMNQERISAIKKYLNAYAGKFPEETLVNQLKKVGYTDEEINFSKNAKTSVEPAEPATPQPPTQQPIQATTNQAEYPVQTPMNQSLQEGYNNQYYNSENRFNNKKILKILSILIVMGLLLGGGWWATNTFLFYKGLKTGNFEVAKEIKNIKHEEIIAKIDKIESTKEKVKLYITIKNNLSDKEYYMYGDILGSFNIKDQDKNSLKPFQKDYEQEEGGDLDVSSITLKPGDSASGWVSFINPSDKKITSITIEGDKTMFGSTDKINI